MPNTRTRRKIVSKSGERSMEANKDDATAVPEPANDAAPGPASPLRDESTGGNPATTTSAAGPATNRGPGEPITPVVPLHPMFQPKARPPVPAPAPTPPTAPRSTDRPNFGRSSSQVSKGSQHRDLAEIGRWLVYNLKFGKHRSYRDEIPKYNFGDRGEMRGKLVTTSTPTSFCIGTGSTLFRYTLGPAMLQARSEIVFVTCFWADSSSLATVRSCLVQLVEKRKALASPLPPLRVRICVSSTGVVQKLFHSQSRAPHVYDPTTWEAELGLPSMETLRSGGIELVVKSLFFLPTSVLHAKYIVIDRQRVFFPSCNVSWERWVEACIEADGPVVDRTLEFYGATWDDDLPVLPVLPALLTETVDDRGAKPGQSATVRKQGAFVAIELHNKDLEGIKDINTLLLPSSHHRDLFWVPYKRFCWGLPRMMVRRRRCPPATPSPPLANANEHTRSEVAALADELARTAMPSSAADAPGPVADAKQPWVLKMMPKGMPKTPLNYGTLGLLMNAKSSIYIQTPNLTFRPLVKLLVKKAMDGVNVTLVTNFHMMMVEQIVTAGSATKWTVNNLRKHYIMERARASGPVGALRIFVYGKRKASYNSDADEMFADRPSQNLGMPDGGTDLDPGRLWLASEEPAFTHAKLMIVDGKYTLMGSGNMDRASFCSSQELGVVFESEPLAAAMQSCMKRFLKGRRFLIFPGKGRDGHLDVPFVAP